MLTHDETTTVTEVSTAFTLLNHPRRRAILYALPRTGTITVDEIADRLATWQTSQHASVTPTEIKTSLIHTHLPKLADANVITYNNENGTVARASDADQLAPFLQTARTREPSLSNTMTHS